jgi:Tat protein translocase TatB subunit
MYGIGVGELVLIFAAALLFVGPKDLPKVARWLGRTLRFARKGLRQFLEAMELEDDVRELKETGAVLKDTVKEFKEDLK